MMDKKEFIKEKIREFTKLRDNCKRPDRADEIIKIYEEELECC